jgi:hypothetical protein
VILPCRPEVRRAHQTGSSESFDRYDALDYRKIKTGNAGPFGTYPILSVLPDKFARFLFDYHSGRLENLDLPILPDDAGLRPPPMCALYAVEPTKYNLKIIGISCIIDIKRITCLN